MALLDLQSLEEPEESKGVAAKSASSKGCGPSSLSLLIC
jgi:SapB morphogen precursor RamS